jgi:hypothetical protein
MAASVMTTQTQAPVSQEKSIIIRQATAADAEAGGRICFEAFGSLAARHGFPAYLLRAAF